jgi:hypothetical protein
MLNVMVHDNKDRCRRLICVHSVGHAESDACIAVTALVQSFAAMLLSIEAERPNDLFVQAKRGDAGEFEVSAISTDCWDQHFHDQIHGAVFLLKVGLANYCSQSDGTACLTISDSHISLISWRAKHPPGQDLLPIMATG